MKLKKINSKKNTLINNKFLITIFMLITMLFYSNNKISTALAIFIYNPSYEYKFTPLGNTLNNIADICGRLLLPLIITIIILLIILHKTQVQARNSTIESEKIILNKKAFNLFHCLAIILFVLAIVFFYYELWTNFLMLKESDAFYDLSTKIN